MGKSKFNTERDLEEFKRIKKQSQEVWLDDDDIKFLIDLIEQLQKENEDLKAKLEYKQYGDLDNTEFEKYINDIVENRTKELKEQLEEEQELNKIIKETRINKVLENNIEVKKLREENKELKADNYEANNIIKDLLDNIPVKKVKDKISEYKNRIAKLHPASDIAEIEMLEDKIEALEELLEGSNEQNENI